MKFRKRWDRGARNRTVCGHTGAQARNRRVRHALKKGACNRRSTGGSRRMKHALKKRACGHVGAHAELSDRRIIDMEMETNRSHARSVRRSASK